MTKLNEAQLVASLDAIAQQVKTTPAFLTEFPFLLLGAYGMGETRLRHIRGHVYDAVNGRIVAK